MSVYVLYEVTIKEGMSEAYLERAGSLKDELSKTPGVIRTERFKSLATEGKLLSLSGWESEEAVEAWRNQMNHRMSQAAGRDSIFEGYDIAVLEPTRRYSMDARNEAPADSNAYFGLA